MKLPVEIIVSPDRLSAGLSQAIKVCSQIELDDADVCSLRFSGGSFVTPAFMLPFVVYAESRKSEVKVEGCSNYMRSVGLDKLGVDTSEMRPSEFVAYIEGFSKKPYLPLIKFPAMEKNAEERGQILTAVENILTKQAALPSNIVSGLRYMIGELTDNIAEHSHSKHGYIITQCYPNLGYVDVCIGDTGRTLLGSYRDSGTEDVNDDQKALVAAVSGKSIKNYPGAENRGFGISTSRNMLVDGMGGQYLMLSGSAVYIKTKENEGCMAVPRSVRFEGTVAALRIPYNNKDFMYLDFVEFK